MNVQMFTTCPQCGGIAEIRDYFVLDSTDGPIEHIRTLCVCRHWFQLPTASLERVTAVLGSTGTAAQGWGRAA